MTTAPTREEFSLGFLIGGPVGIDVGRSRLARESAQTVEVLQRLVKLVHSGIILLADAVGRSPAPWNAPFGDGASPAMVLGSLFEVLTSSILHPAAAAAWEHEVVRGLLGSGFLDRVAIVPDTTGTLRRVSELDRCLDDELAAPFVRDLIQKSFPWEAVAVEPGVSERLKGLRYGATLKPLSVLDAVSRIYPEASRLETSAATHMLVLKQLKDKVRDETWSALKGHLSGCSLKARGGAWCLIRDLLLARSEDDDATEEALLFGFAPDARRLPMDSPDDVVELVALFRRRAQVRFEEILQWARSASNDEAREAVVRYMFDGRHDTDLTDALFDDRPAWLTDELIQKVGKKLGKSANVVDSKRIATGTTSLAATPSDPRRAEPSLSPSSLDNILEWWRRDGPSREKSYMKAVYPPAWRDAARLRDALQGGDRKAWSVLCMLAMCQRLGRSRPEQHRVFMERHPAWIDVLAAEGSTSDDWIRLIDDWISAQEVSEEYSHWLGLYPSFRRLWRVSRELYPLLRTAPPPELPPDRLFSFRDNPALSGTGVVLPRFSRAFGDRGRAWLCRELVRLGVWEFKPSQRYYVPWRIMCQIVDVPEGADAAAIAEGLEQHLGDPVPFGRVFDLPFDILRFDKSLRAELLDVEDDDDSTFADDDDAVEGGKP